MSPVRVWEEPPKKIPQYRWGIFFGGICLVSNWIVSAANGQYDDQARAPMYSLDILRVFAFSEASGVLSFHAR